MNTIPVLLDATRYRHKTGCRALTGAIIIGRNVSKIALIAEVPELQLRNTATAAKISLLLTRPSGVARNDAIALVFSRQEGVCGIALVPNDVELILKSMRGNRMKRRCFHISALAFRVYLRAILVVAGGCAWISHAEGQDPKKRFFEEGPPNWQKIIDGTRVLQGTAVMKSKQNLPKPDILERSDRFRQNANGAVYILAERAVSGLEQNLIGKVFGQNSKYGFLLGRDHPSKEWLLEKTEFGSDALVLGRKARTQVEKALLVHISQPLLQPIPEALRDGNLRIVGVTLDENKDRTLARVAFEYSNPTSKLKDDKMAGFILLDPKNYWHVVSYDAKREILHQSVVARNHGRIFVKVGSQGLPILVRSESASIVENSKKGTRFESEQVTDFELFEDANVPESELTLSAFGLDEPMGIEWQRPTRWHFWLIGGAVVSLLAYLGLRAYRLRKSTTSQKGV